VSRAERYSKCLCNNCGGHIEFPIEGAGSTVSCPHCNWPTLLVAESSEGRVPIGGGAATRKRIYQGFAIAAALVMVAGAAFYRFWYLPHLQTDGGFSTTGASVTNTNRPKPVVVVHLPPPDPWHGLMAGAITLEKVGGGNLVYAIGSLSNSSDHQRFGIKVDLDVFDSGKTKVGTATDYTPSIDPGKEWKYKALVTDRTAASAKLISVKEN
jgi:hypothetical protein